MSAFGVPKVARGSPTKVYRAEQGSLNVNRSRAGRFVRVSVAPRSGKGTGVATRVVGLLVLLALLALLMAGAADARPEVPSRFGNVETAGQNKLTYTWGDTRTVAVSGANQITYEVRVTVDDDGDRGNGNVANWSLGATPRFLLSATYDDDDVFASPEQTISMVRIVLVWDGGQVTNRDFGSSETNTLDLTSPWVYAYTTLTAEVPTNGVTYDAGVLCASGSDWPTNLCREVWTPGPAMGAHGTPSAGGLNFTGVFRVVLEVKVGLNSNTVNSDECAYISNAYQCSDSDAGADYQERRIGFIQVTPAPNVVEPREAASCATLDHFAMRGDDVCVKVEYNASAWRYSGDVRNLTRTAFDDTSEVMRGVECFSDSECWLLSYEQSAERVVVRKLTVNSDNTITIGTGQQLFDPVPQGTPTSKTPLSIRSAYFTNGANANRLVVLYTQTDSTGTSGASMYKSVWTYDSGTGLFTQAQSNRRIWDGSSNSVTYVTLSVARGGPSNEYLVACSSGSAVGTGIAPQMACMAWEGDVTTDPTSGQTVSGFNSTDINGGTNDRNSYPFVCGVEESSVFGIAYVADDNTLGTRDIEIMRMTRVSNTWAVESSSVARISNVQTGSIQWRTHCVHTGSHVWWFNNHAADQLERVAPEQAFAVLDASVAFGSGSQTPSSTHHYPAFSDATSYPVHVWVNDSFVELGADGPTVVTGRIYSTWNLLPESENLTYQVPGATGSASSINQGASVLNGARNKTAVLIVSTKDLVVVQMGAAEALNITVYQGSTIIASKVEEMNTASKNWTFRMPADASLNEYQIKVEPIGYSGASRLPWFSQGCVSSCAMPPAVQYLLTGPTDPDGGSYADGGLFVEEELSVASCTAGASRAVYNRGESWGATCVVYDEWNTTSNNGGSALVKNKAMNVTTLFASDASLASGSKQTLTTDSSGVFTCASCFSVPVTTSGAGSADDTYLGSNNADESPVTRANALRVTMLSTESYAASGSWGESPAFYDYDDDYYLDASTVAWSTIMRLDGQRVAGTLTNARDVVVPSGTSLTVTVKQPGGGTETSATKTTYASNGTTEPLDWTADITESTGTWSVTYAASNAVGANNGNTLAETTGTGFTLSTTIGVSSFTIDVTGQTTTDYFNRAESLWLESTLTHAGGGALRKLNSDGTSSGRAMRVVAYSTTAGEAGQWGGGTTFTPSTTTGVGIFSNVVPVTASDTYASGSHSQAETKDWDLLFYDDGATSTGSDGNRATSLNAFDVDANYYLSSDTRAWATVMRGDDQRVTASLVGVRGQVAPNSVWAHVDYVDPTGATVTSAERQIASGVTNPLDYTFPITAERGAWVAKFSVVANATNNQNSMAVEDGTTWTLASVIGITGQDIDVAGESTTKYFNLGESARFAGTLTHADGSAYRKLNADGTTSARTVGIHYYSTTRGETGSFGDASASVSSSTGGITASETDAAVSTSATDTYTSSTHSTPDAGLGWNALIYDGTTPGTPANVDGNYVNVTAFFEVDANYYMTTSTRAWETVMRDDEQRVTATLVGVRGQSAPDTVWATVEYVDPTGATASTDARQVASGTTNPFDYTFPAAAERGVWKVRVTVVANTTNAQNSMAATDGATWTLSSVIGISSQDIDVAGMSTSKYFNRGEVARFAGTLTHADGGAYRKLKANGTTTERTAGVYYYASTRGEVGAFGDASAAVSSSTGVLTSTDTDVMVPTTATDTYASAAHSQAEATEWSVIVYDGTIPGMPSNVDGNYVNVTGFFDVDANYYYSASAKSPSGTMMRGDTVGATVTLMGVRGQGVPDDVTVTTRFYDNAATLQSSDTSTTTSGTTARVDAAIGNAWATGASATVRFLVPSGATGASENTLAETTGQTYTLAASIGLSSLATNTAGTTDAFKVYNRGESIDVTGCLAHADGGNYRIKTPTGESARTVTVQLYLNNYGATSHYVEGMTTVGPSTCAFSKTLALPTTAADTFNRTAVRTVDADGYNWDVRIWDGGSSTSSTNGNDVASMDQFDADATYYVDTDFVRYATVMRNDQQRVTVTWVDAQDTTVPDGTSVAVAWVDAAAMTWESGARATTSGTTANYDYTFPQDASVGTWSPTYSIAANATNSQNSAPAQTRTTFELSRIIGLSEFGIDVADQTTTDYFNRGETVRFYGTLAHADGGTYRRLMADGTTENRTFAAHQFLDTLGSTGSFTSPTVTIPKATGVIPTSIDVVVPTNAPDSYASSTFGQSESVSWDTYGFDGGSPTDTNGNAFTFGDWFDVDANYYWKENTLYFTDKLMRGDTQRVNATFVNVRGVNVPDGTSVDVKWYDNDGAVDTVYAGTTTGGNVSDAAFSIPIDWKVGPDDEPGTGKTQYTINGSVGANLGNSMLETSASSTGSTFLIDRVITVTYVTSNPQDAPDAYKAYNRGETIVVNGTLQHADGGPYRVKNPNGTNDRYTRNVTVQIWDGETNASYGNSAFEQTLVQVDSDTGTFSVTFVVPSTATDTYDDSTARQSNPFHDYSIRFYDEGGTTSSDAQGNNGHALNMLEVDSGVYLDQYWQGRNDTDTNDLNFNTGTDGAVGPDSDFTRVYVKNVRGDATTQFNNLKVTRNIVDPNTLASTGSTQTMGVSGSLYRYAWGEWPEWTNRMVDYALTSADTNGNTAVFADGASTTKTGGEAHYVVARVEVLDTHLLRGQEQKVSVVAADSLDDYADNALFDMSAGVFTDASVSGSWDEFTDASASSATSETFSGQSSPFELSRTMAVDESLGYSDLRVTLAAAGDARLRGTEWVSGHGATNHHERFDAVDASSGASYWRVTNQTDWERGGPRTGVDTSVEPGALLVASGASSSNWTSGIRDVGVSTKPESDVSCKYSIGSGGGSVSAWFNTSENEFSTAPSSSTAAVSSGGASSGTLSVPVAGLSNGRYHRMALVLNGVDTKVTECVAEYGAAAGSALGDGIGAWRVDDLAVVSVALERLTYSLDVDPTVDAAVTYAYVQSAASPQNESYGNLRTRLYMPNGSLAVTTSQADVNTLTNATTNESGVVVHRFTLTSIAQAGSPWSVNADTYTTGGMAGEFAVAIMFGEVEWFAREYSNSTRALINATIQNRGEEVRVELPVINNPGGFQPTGGVVTDDVDDVVLTESVLFDNLESKFYASWVWPSDTTADYGTEHRPTISYTINGLDAFSQPSTPAKLYSNFTVGNIWHALSPSDTEEADVFVSGAHLVWVWADQFNARGEPYDRLANYTWLHTNVSSGVEISQNAPLSQVYPATTSANHGSETALNGGSSLPHIRTGYTSVAATAPAGTWHYTASATDGAGNNASRTETIAINSPVTPWAFRCTGHSPEYRVGMTVNMSCYFLEKQSDGSVVPVEPNKPVYIQWFAKSLNNATLSNLTGRQVMNLTNFVSDDSGAQALYGERRALAWGNYSIPLDLTLYLNRGIGFRVDTVYNGISIDYHASLEISPTEQLGKITSLGEKVVGPGKVTAFQARTSLTHPQLGPIAWGPDSCRTSFQTNATTCVGDQQGTVRMVIKAINSSCDCWATYNDPNNPVNDGTSLVNPTLIEMEKDYRYTNGAGGFGFTYTYNWTPPGSLSGKTFYVWYAAEFYGQNVTWVEEFTVNTLGGADPLKVTFPATVHIDRQVGFDIHSSFLNATARTGAASSIFVTVRDPTLEIVVSGANPVELGDGQYLYNFTPSERGQYRVSVTTPSNSGGWESASGTFWAEFDTIQNLTRIEENTTGADVESLRAFVASFWSNTNGSWEEWNASFASFESRTNDTWGAWNASFTTFNASLRQAMVLSETNLTQRLADFEANGTARLDGWFRWMGSQLVPFSNVTTQEYGNRTNVTLGFWSFERDAQVYATVSVPSFFVAGQSTTVYANITMEPTGISRAASDSFTLDVTVNGVTRSATTTVTFGPSGETYAVPVVFEGGVLSEGDSRVVNVTLKRSSTPVAWNETSASVFGVSSAQTRSFGAGWRFTSLPNVMGNVSVEQAFESWNVDIVKWYDANGLPYVWQRGDPLGLNNLVTVNRTMGLWVHVVTDEVEQVDSGYLSSESVRLTDGADNYVAFLGASEQAPSAMAAQLGTVTYVVSTYEPSTGQFLTYDSAAGGIKTLTTMSPGKAYIVRPTGSTLWSVTNP